jgi:hypothetical protein
LSSLLSRRKFQKGYRAVSFWRVTHWMSVKDSMLASAPPIRLPLPEFPTPPKGIWASSATVWSLLEDAGLPKAW